MTERPSSTGLAGLRLAVTTFTVVPLRPGRVDRRTAAVAMALAPLVGLGIGAVAAAAAYGAAQLWPTAAIAAVVTVVVLAAVTGGLHLDGLADTADGIGVSGDRARRLDVMRSGPVGAFGVTAVGLVLLVDVVALAAAIAAGHGTLAVLTAVTTGRLAVTWLCSVGTPAARPDGLGATVAGVVDWAWSVSVTILTGVVLCLVARWHDHDWDDAGRICWTIAAGLVVVLVLRFAAVRRLGGITGDVLGAAVEVTGAICLLAFTASL